MFKMVLPCKRATNDGQTHKKFNYNNLIHELPK